MSDLLHLFTAVDAAKANLRTAEERLKEGCAEWSRIERIWGLRPEQIRLEIERRERRVA